MTPDIMKTWVSWPEYNLTELLKAALKEDLGGQTDWTSILTVPPDRTGTAVMKAKMPMVVSGLAMIAHLFSLADPHIVFTPAAQEGESVEKGTILARIAGSLTTMLIAERTALNLLQRWCGIASLTRRFVDAVEGTDVRILDTRKTTPLWRRQEKNAVLAGGGSNHRFGLYDMILIKDNHIDAAGGLKEALRSCLDGMKQRGISLPVEVEARTLDEVKAALDFPIQRLLLDNMDLITLRRAVAMVDGRMETEASGNISLENIREVAKTGVQFISIGCLTHSAPAADISMLITSP